MLWGFQFGEQTLKALKRETYDFIKERQRSNDDQEILKEQEAKERLFQVGGKKGRAKSPKSDKKRAEQNTKLQNVSVKDVSVKDDKVTLKSAKTSKQK